MTSTVDFGPPLKTVFTFNGQKYQTIPKQFVEMNWKEYADTYEIKEETRVLSFDINTQNWVVDEYVGTYSYHRTSDETKVKEALEKYFDFVYFDGDDNYLPIIYTRKLSHDKRVYSVYIGKEEILRRIGLTNGAGTYDFAIKTDVPYTYSKLVCEADEFYAWNVQLDASGNYRLVYYSEDMDLLAHDKELFMSDIYETEYDTISSIPWFDLFNITFELNTEQFGIM